MRLNITNFAKIKEANITIDGITVIAGENNTGKSTVGKILFALFNALSDIEDKILDERLKEIQLSNQMILKNHASLLGTFRMVTVYTARLSNEVSREIKRRIEDKTSITKETMRNVIETRTHMREKNDGPENAAEWNDLIDELYQNTMEILALPEEAIVLEVISRYFNALFHAQVNSLSQSADSETSLELEIKTKKNRVSFSKNQCIDYVKQMELSHKAIYIDNPFVIDELSYSLDSNPMSEYLKTLLTNGFGENMMEGVIETVRAKEKLSDVYQTLQGIVDGEIMFSQADGEFYLKSGCFDEPLSVHNLSTGMKSFVILKMLLEKGCIKEKDVIILDEPEIHLHPQWQIAYAELIVLLQKHFDLSVVVTTHSPYFVDAINLFSCKYGSDSKVNYYLSTNAGDAAVMENVTDHIDLVYKKMASPIQMLDTLRYELNNQ